MTILLLALGIGASTAGIGIAYGTLVRPLQYPDGAWLAALWQETEGRREQLSAPDFHDLRRLPALETTALLWSGRATLMSGTDVDRVTTVEAEAALLPMLGARALHGRLTAPSDMNRPVVVIAHRLWRTIFHGDEAIINRSVRLNDRVYTVVGVLADGLAFELPIGGPSQGFAFTVKDVDVWLPFGAGGGFPDSRAVLIRSDRQAPARGQSARGPEGCRCPWREPGGAVSGDQPRARVPARAITGADCRHTCVGNPGRAGGRITDSADRLHECRQPGRRRPAGSPA